MVSWQRDDYELQSEVLAVTLRAAEAYRSATPTPNIMKEYGIGGGGGALAPVSRAWSLRHDWRVQPTQVQSTQVSAPSAPQGNSSVQNAPVSYKPSTVSNPISGSAGNSAARQVAVGSVVATKPTPPQPSAVPSKPIVSVPGGMSAVGVTRSVSAPMPPTPAPAPPGPAVVGPPVPKASCSELTARQMSYVQVPKANANPSVLAQRPRGGQQDVMATSAVDGTPRAPMLTRATRARAPAQSPPVKKVMSPNPNVVQAQNNSSAHTRTCFTSRCQTPMTERKTACTPGRHGLPSTRFSSGHFSVPAPIQTPRPELEYRQGQETREAASPAPPASTLVASQRSFPANRSSPSRARASSVPPVTAADYPLRECTPAHRRPGQPVMRQSSCHGFGPTGPDSREFDVRFEVATVGPPVTRPIEVVHGSASSRISVFAPSSRQMHGHPSTSSTSKPSFLSSVAFQDPVAQPVGISTPAGPLSQSLSPLIAAQRFVYSAPGAVESAIQRSMPQYAESLRGSQVCASEASFPQAPRERRDSKTGKQLAVTFLHSPCSSVSSLPTLPPEPADDASATATAQDEGADLTPITEKDLRIMDLEAQVMQLEGERCRVDKLEEVVKRLELTTPLQSGAIAPHGGTGTTMLAQEVHLETSGYVLNAVAEAVEEAEPSPHEPSPPSTVRAHSEAEANNKVGELRHRVDSLAAMVFSRSGWEDCPQPEADAATGGLRNHNCSTIPDDGCTGSSPIQYHASPRQQKPVSMRVGSSPWLFETSIPAEGLFSPPSPSKPSRVSITTKPW